MTASRHPPSFTPRLMQRRAAAAYLGVSETKLAGLGIPRKEFGGNVVYERADLDAFADSLPYVGEGKGGPNSCDAAFGVSD